MDKMTCQTCGADWLVRARDTSEIEMRACTGCSDGIAFDALNDGLADVGVSEVCRADDLAGVRREFDGAVEVTLVKNVKVVDVEGGDE